MAREYKRDRYVDLIGEIREKITDLVLSTDIIVGFPGETEEDFQSTLSLYDEIGFDQAFMFIYSARPGTPAHAHFEDLPKSVKTNRLQKLIDRQKAWSLRSNRSYVGKQLRILVRDLTREGDFVAGHSDQNHTVLMPKTQITRLGLHQVKISQATPHLLYGNSSTTNESAFPLVMAS
jgi:tRNA-2-methylthio-N6-dimethylallyladenosine synthase